MRADCPSRGACRLSTIDDVCSGLLRDDGPAPSINKKCAFDVEEHQRMGPRVMAAAKSTAFGDMAAARQPLRTENMGAEGRRSTVERGTSTSIK